MQELDYPKLPGEKGRLFQETIERVRDLAAKVKADRLGRYSTSTNAAIPATASIAPRPRHTAQVYVPITRASLVLGTQGETLKRLEKMSGASIALDQTYTDSEQRRFLVSGLPEDIDEARRLIIDRPLNFSNYPSINISVPQVRVGLIIGKRGETIREIQEKSGAKVMVTPDMSSSRDNPNRERIVTVMGEEEAVGRAKDMIEEIVYGVVKSGASSCLNTIRNSAIMQIPDAATGAVIGKRAETMKGIQEVSGCKLFVDPHPVEGTLVRNVYITGPPESMAVAQQLITEKVRIVDPTFGYGAGALGAAGTFGSTAAGTGNMYNQQQPALMDQQSYSAWVSQYYPQLDSNTLSQYYAHYVATFNAQLVAPNTANMYQQADPNTTSMAGMAGVYQAQVDPNMYHQAYQTQADPNMYQQYDPYQYYQQQPPQPQYEEMKKE